MAEDLICRIHVSVAVEVVCAVKESSSMVTKVLGQGLSHGLAVSRG